MTPAVGPDSKILTPLFPDSKLESSRRRATAEITTRIIDLISPIGKGRRGHDRLSAQGGKDNGS